MLAAVFYKPVLSNSGVVRPLRKRAAASSNRLTLIENESGREGAFALRIMTHENELDRERQKTRDLLFTFNLVGILVPCAAGLLIAGYFFLAGQQLGHKEWKLIVFCLWLGTLAVLLYVALRHYRPEALHEAHETAEVETTPASSAAPYERRVTGKLIHEIFVGAVVAPLLSGAAVYCYFTSVRTVPLDNEDWRRVAFCIWLFTVLYLVVKGCVVSRAQKMLVKK